MSMSIPEKSIDRDRHQQGSALVIALIVLAILGALGYAALDVAELNIFMSANDRDSKEAFFHADSGANVGQQMIMNVHDGNVTFSVRNANDWINDPFNASEYPMKIHHTGTLITHIRAGELRADNLSGFSIEFGGYGGVGTATFTDYLVRSYREGHRNSASSVDLGWKVIKIQKKD